VLFDFGGVLAEEGFSEGLEALADEQGLPVEDMTQAGMRAVYDSGYVTGQGTAADFWALLRERTGLRGDDTALTKRVLDGFTVRPWMLELVQRLRSLGHVTGILSDQTDWLDRLDAEQHFYRCFDRIYNSYRIGKGKRDPSTFTDVAADLGLSPSQILFVDDNEHHLARARAVGLNTIHYRDRAAFLQELDRWLLTG
jgi:putative hydrolase of the HAD superfamily